MDGRNLRSSNRRLAIPIFGLLIALAGAACSGGAGGGGGSSASTITLAAVDNPSMADLKKLVPDFESSHSGIKVNIVTLPEDQLRQQVTQDVAAKSGRYDLFTIGTYEVPLWAKKGWIENLSPFIAKDSSYAPDDLIPGIRGALSYNSNLYAVPFYGESSMLMYRKDLLSAAGVNMPDHPTWDQVAAAAKAVNSSSVNGICLRGLPGWGEQLAPLDTVVNTYGGRWFDQNWNAQLTTQPSHDAGNAHLDVFDPRAQSSRRRFRPGDPRFNRTCRRLSPDCGSGPLRRRPVRRHRRIPAAWRSSLTRVRQGDSWRPDCGSGAAKSAGVGSSRRQELSALTDDYESPSIGAWRQRRAGTNRRLRCRPGCLATPSAPDAGVHICRPRDPDPVCADDLLQLLLVEPSQGR